MVRGDDLFEAIRELVAGRVSSDEMDQELWRRFGRRLAVLIMDSSGFTRVTADKGIVHYLSCLANARDVIGSVFEEHGCCRFRPEADNHFATFESVQAAFESALDANRSLGEACIMLGDGDPFRICVGIGFGDVLCSETEGAFGHEVNLASKLGEDTAKPGEILLTESAYAALEDERGHLFEKGNLKSSGVTDGYYLTKAHQAKNQEE